MDNLTQGMGEMTVSGPTTPRGQGTTAHNLQPQRPAANGKGKGKYPGKKLHFGYQMPEAGGGKKRRRKSRRKSRKSKRKSRKGKKKRKTRRKKKSRRRRR